MKRREMKLLLEERFERIALLETRIDTMDQLVEGYRAREQAVLDAMQTAKENAARALEQVQAQGAQIRAEAQQVLAEAEQTRLSARAEAEALLSDAISAANTLKAEAERKGLEVTAGVRADSERMLRDAEIIKREYEEMVDSFNAMLEQNASELEITAARFAEFVKNRKIDRAEVRLDGNAFYKSVSEMNDATLPDASEDPALLMQNIYRIQNRPLPEDRIESAPVPEPEPPAQAEKLITTQEAAAEPIAETAPQPEIEILAMEPESAPDDTPEFPIEDGSGADERKSAAEPYSEAACANEAQQSESEPQAEFVKTFDDAFVKSDYTIHDDECSVMQADAEHAFDSLMSGGEMLAGAAAVTIPTVAALAADQLDAKPMEDAARAFDAYFDETFEPAAKTAQDESALEQAIEPQDIAPEAPELSKQEDQASEEDPMSISDEKLQELLDTIMQPESQPAPEAATAPEPYSAQAWSHDSFTSDLEPQAEGALFGAQDASASIPAMVENEYQQPSSSEAEKAFDDYLANIDSFASPAPTAEPTAPVEPAAPEASATPEPYSAQAWSHDSFTSDLEPQAEGALFGAQDASTSIPAMVDNEYQQPSSSEAEKAFDDYLANIASFTTPAPTAEPVAPVEIAASEAAAAPEPYSEQAWANEAQQSKSEPQAEFVKTFDDAFVKSDYTIHDGECSVMQADAEHAFDDYLANIDSFASPAPTAEPAAPVETAAPEPYSAQAWANEAQQSKSEPQAEFVKTFDDYLANIDSFASPAPTAEPAAPEAVAAPEPYSAQDWSHDSFTSDLEPQAEGALFGEQDASPGIPARVENEYQQPSSSEAEKAFDDYLANIASFTSPAPAAEPAIQASNSPEPAQPEADAYAQKASSLDAEQAFDDYFGNATAAAPQADSAAYDSTQEPEEEEEPAPAPRKYNEYGEIREWEPEPEPEADLDDVPTVSRYMGQSDQSDDISLDDLLDEIIKAGD